MMSTLKKSTKTDKQQEKILNHMEENKEYRLQDFCDLLGLKETRTKEIMKPLISDGKISVIWPHVNKTSYYLQSKEEMNYYF